MGGMAADALIFDLDGTVWDSAAWFASGLFGDDSEAVEAMRLELITDGNIVGALRRVSMRAPRSFKYRGGPYAKNMFGPLFDSDTEATYKAAQMATSNTIE